MKKLFFALLIFVIPFVSVTHASTWTELKKQKKQEFISVIIAQKNICNNNKPCIKAKLKDYFLTRIKTLRKTKKVCRDQEKIGKELQICIWSLYFKKGIAEEFLEERHNNKEGYKTVIGVVVDGDTIVTEKGERIRVLGVDAPEKGEEFYNEAKEFTKHFVLGKAVTLFICEEKSEDKYGRTLADVVTLEGKNLGSELVKNGFAKSYIIPPCGKKFADEIQNLENISRRNGIGIWSVTGSQEKFSNEVGVEEIEEFLILTEAHPDAMGNDNNNPNGEYMVFKNVGTKTINFTNLILRDRQNHEYVFPYFLLSPGKSFTIYTGIGKNTDTKLYMNHDKSIWNNSGDTISIFTPGGKKIFQKIITKNKVYISQ